ncbi:MAG: TetR/AcrR family transcriptional regulator [Butyrivibrio sp.]|nr:TetR/AcrR family transcriptional regulator [Butyrivibrio sp.]
MEDIKAKVIDEAIAYFNEKGLKFTIDELVEEIHISKKTVYKLFGNKVELLKDAVDYVFEQIKEKENEIIADDSIELLDKITLVISCLPDKYADIDFGKVYQLKAKYPEVYDHIIDRIENSWENADKLLEEAMEKNLIRKIPITFIRLMLIGCIEQTIRSTDLTTSGCGYGEALKEMVSVMMMGIKV